MEPKASWMAFLELIRKVADSKFIVPILFFSWLSGQLYLVAIFLEKYLK